MRPLEPTNMLDRMTFAISEVVARVQGQPRQLRIVVEIAVRPDGTIEASCAYLRGDSSFGMTFELERDSGGWKAQGTERWQSSVLDPALSSATFNSESRSASA